jgi:hypothetical protein
MAETGFRAGRSATNRHTSTDSGQHLDLGGVAAEGVLGSDIPAHGPSWGIYAHRAGVHGSSQVRGEHGVAVIVDLDFFATVRPMPRPREK